MEPAAYGQRRLRVTSGQSWTRLIRGGHGPRALTTLKVVSAYPPPSPKESRGGSMRKRRRGWIMPADDARSVLPVIEERIRSSETELRHRDALIRLREMIEEDLSAATHPNIDESEEMAGEAAFAPRRTLRVSG